MKTSTLTVSLLVALGSLEGCVAAAVPQEADSGAPGTPAMDSGGGRPMEAGHDASFEEAAPKLVVEASLPDVKEAGRRADAADAAHAPDAADGGASKDGGKLLDAGGSMDVEASKTIDTGPPPPIDSGPICPPGESLCGATCIDTQSDPDHCGGCNINCPGVPDGVAICSSGGCGVACDSSYHACGGACDSNTSIDSCGTSCTPCAAPANATSTCDGTSCGFACDSGFHACGGTCDDSKSVESCGSSCTSCPVPVNGNATCDGTACGIACNPGTVSCGGGTACCTVNLVAGGDGHTCVQTGMGLECVGLGSSGQLGDGSTTTADKPTSIALSPDAVAIVAGYDHSCALNVLGGVQCWGDGTNGDLGDGWGLQRNSPVDVSGLSSGAVAIAAGQDHTCAVTTSGGVECWGDNSSGQLGVGTTTAASSPQSVSALSGVVGIACGDADSCAVTSTGSVWCWGDNEYGQLGTGTSSASPSLTPVEVTGLSGAVSVVVGAEFACALTSAASVWCWGRGNLGEMGNGTNVDVNPTPGEIPSSSFGGESIVAISTAAIGVHVCALTASGALWCWGDNYYGQLGNGTTTLALVPSVVKLPAGATATAIGLGDWFSCAAVAGAPHPYYCWGQGNYYQLATGLTANSDTPVPAYF